MSDYNILTFYPRPGGRLDLLAGLKAWLDEGGRFQAALAVELAAFDPESRAEPVRRGYHYFDKADLNTLRPFIEQYDLIVTLNAPWFTMSIDVTSYHLAADPLIFWSYDPALWGSGEGGIVRAEAAVLAFARASGAAYVLTVSDLGHEVVRHRFVRDGAGYRFALPPTNPRRGHRMRWVDVCPELGGTAPAGYVEEDRSDMPFGYTRHVLAGTNASIPDDE